MSYETILVEHKNQVDYLTLNRPEALNSINSQMVTDLRDYFRGLMENTDTRLVVMKVPDERSVPDLILSKRAVRIVLGTNRLAKDGGFRVTLQRSTSSCVVVPNPSLV